MASSETCAADGVAACRAGDSDSQWDQDPLTSAGDTIANVLHALTARLPELATHPEKLQAVFDRACGYYWEESAQHGGWDGGDLHRAAEPRLGRESIAGS